MSKAKPEDTAETAPEAPAEKPVLRYIGGGQSIPDVPARDLADADLNMIAVLWEKDPGVVRSELLASNLYKEA